MINRLVVVFILCVSMLMTATNLTMAQPSLCDGNFTVMRGTVQTPTEIQDTILDVFDCVIRLARPMRLSDVPFTVLPQSDANFLTMQFDAQCEQVQHLIDKVSDYCSDSPRFVLNLLEIKEGKEYAPQLLSKNDHSKEDMIDDSKYKRTDCIVSVVFNFQNLAHARSYEHIIVGAFENSVVNAVNNGYIQKPPCLSYRQQGSDYYVYLQYCFDCETKSQLTQGLLEKYILPRVPDPPKYRITDHGIEPSTRTIDCQGAWWID